MDARWQMMMASLEGGLAFQKGLGAGTALSHALGTLRPPFRIRHAECRSCCPRSCASTRPIPASGCAACARPSAWARRRSPALVCRAEPPAQSAMSFGRHGRDASDPARYGPHGPRHFSAHQSAAGTEADFFQCSKRVSNQPQCLTLQCPLRSRGRGVTDAGTGRCTE